MKTRGSPSGLVTVFQPYVPQYRVSLFETVRELLAQDGLSFQVAHPQPPADQAQRDDARTAEWSRTLSSSTIHLRGHDLHVRRTAALATASDVVVAELASTNLDTYRLALTAAPKLILWGHGQNYVTEHSRVDAALERWLARRAAWVLVYTDGGRAHLQAAGIPAGKLMVLRNSTDTVALRNEVADISTYDEAEFAHSVGVTGHNVGVFIGALDPSKNIGLLLAASSRIREKVPDFQLLIAGAGPSRAMVQSNLSKHPEVILLPHADRRTVALMGAVGDVCLMPGRVGLVAVDAMTLGLPVVTTDWPLHAPEREYLEDGFTTVTTQDPSEYADAVVRVLADRAALTRSSAAAQAASQQYSIQHMAEQMYTAIVDVRDRRLAAAAAR